MLLRAFFLIALLGMLAETLVQGSASLARVSMKEREAAAMRAALSAAISSAQTAAAQAVASGADPSIAAPAPIATCFDATPSGCAIAVTATVATVTAGRPAESCPDTDCTIYLQENSAVTESRVGYRVNASVLAPNGDVIATRNGDLAFRTFATPPYASLVGSLDATMDAIADGGVGDDGGNASAASTLITVEYVPSGAAASPLPGNVWRATQQHPAANVPAWDR